MSEHRHSEAPKGERTRVVKGPFKTRKNARKEERRLTKHFNDLPYGSAGREASLSALDIPIWMRGFRVERAGFFQYVVVATERKGH